MSTLTFGAEQDGNISCTKVETGQKIIIETNVSLLDETQMRMRLLCDFIKDALAESPLNRNQCKQIITAIYCSGIIKSEPDVNSSPFNQPEINKLLQSDYKKLLAELENILDTAPYITAQTTKLINQPKLSTVGSNTKISDAEYVFWESGFGSDLIMRSPNYQNILTPAAIMDPLGKEAPTAYFPMPNLNIVFDKTFTKRLGFPDTIWECNDIEGLSPQVPIAKQVSIQYTQLSSSSTPEILRAGFIPFINDHIQFTTKPDIKAGPFGPYLKGNKEKNADINEYAKTGFIVNETGNIINWNNIREIIKILETKELGDVAQIWLYLAYLIENNLLTQREKALMITTDSVVYLFCRLLGLSCAYTGPRAGVDSKNCTIYHYVAGPPDYQAKIENMLINAWDIMAQKITSQKFIVTSVVAKIASGDGMNFWYMGNRNGKLSQIQGHTDWTTGMAIDTAKKVSIFERFKEFVIEIDSRTEKLAGIKNGFLNYITANIHTNDTQVMSTFTTYNTQILQLQFEPYFTIVKPEKEGYQKGSKIFLQNKFKEELYPGPIGGGSSIDKVNYMINETSSSKFISEEKNYVGGIRSRSDLSDITKEVSLLEATILIYSYLTLSLPKLIEKLIEEVFDQDEISLFAITYDNLAYNINDDIYTQYYQQIVDKSLIVLDPSTKTRENIILDDENILILGAVLSQYLYFEKDLSDEDRQILDAMVALVRTRATRGVPIPIFLPDTFCEGNYDVITKQKIQPGTGMNIYKKCYSGHTIIRWLKSIAAAPGLDFSTIFLDLFQQLYNPAFPEQGNQLLEHLKSNMAYQEEFIKYLINIFAFMFQHDSLLYVLIQNVIGQKGIDLSMFTPDIPFAVFVSVHEITRIPYIMFDITGVSEARFGGSNKYLLKKIKSKKNRVKKVKSKKNRAKKIKSKQHRLKKIKSKKFTRKNKKSKNGVISVVMF
jgi:hypothetical protein